MIEFQRLILGDRRRNELYAEALRRVIVPGVTTVADLGAGTGFLSFLASRLGAKHCWLYEVSELSDLSRALAKKNRIKNLTFVRAHSMEVADPPRVDVVVSETLGNFALEENTLETLQDAKRFLNPGGVVIPQRLRQFVAPVATSRFIDAIDVWSHIGFELDFTPARELSLNNVFVRTIKASDLWNGPDAVQCWDAIDFRKKTSSVRRESVTWRFAKASTIHGFAVWWECTLLDGRPDESALTLATAPDAPATHWEQIYLPPLEPFELRAGDTLRLDLECDSRPQVKINLKWKTTILDRAGRARQTTRQNMQKGYLE